MTFWRPVLDHERKWWEQALASLEHATVFQGWGWGEAKRLSGWTPIRLAAVGTDGAPRSLAQALARRPAPGLVVAWIPGGPLGLSDQTGAALRTALRQSTRAVWLYCRMNCLYEYSEASAERLRAGGWEPARVPLETGRSLSYPAGLSEDERLALASANWRHNLRRSGRHGLVIRRWKDATPKEVGSVYRQMEAYKGIERGFSDDEIGALLQELREHLVLYRCDDAGGEPIALRGCAVLGRRAWDLFAAAAPAARKVYASHAVFWALAAQCARQGVIEYDMGGVDETRNKGVFDFKRGTGATPLRYLGEWEWASNRWVQRLANAGIRYRFRRR